MWRSSFLISVKSLPRVKHKIWEEGLDSVAGLFDSSLSDIGLY
jgi:hypothetical protein